MYKRVITICRNDVTENVSNRTNDEDNEENRVTKLEFLGTLADGWVKFWQISACG